MSVVIKLALAAVAVLTIGLPVAVIIGARQQTRALGAITEQVLTAPPLSVTPPSPRQDLPAPVAAYLARAVPIGAQISEARLTQAGELRTNVLSERWMAFEATHIVAPRAGSFVWNARVAVAPLLHVGVRDALIGRRGSGQVALLSAFTVGADGGTMEMNSGSLHRFLAEAVWYPSALMPSDNLSWTALDQSRALATLSVESLEVSLEFRFGEAGEVTGIYTPGRWGSFDGGYQRIPWEGHFSDYRDQHGFWIPMNGEVGWHVDGEWRSVWRGTLEGVSYEL